MDQVETQAYVGPEYRALIHVALGELDEAVTLLGAATDAGSNAAMVFHMEPLLLPLLLPAPHRPAEPVAAVSNGSEGHASPP